MTTLALVHGEAMSETSCPAAIFAEFSSEDGALAVGDLHATITKSTASPDDAADIARQPQDTAAPEPATATPTLLALATIAARRRRR